MTQAIINDTESLARQARLAQAFDAEAKRWLDTAEEAAERGDGWTAVRAETQAQISAEAAERIRRRIGSLLPSEIPQAPAMVPQSVALAEACGSTEQAPHQLVPLANWLRSRLGPILTWVTAEQWQRIAYLMLATRPGGAL